MKSKKYLSLAVVLVSVFSLVFVSSALAQTTGDKGQPNQSRSAQMRNLKVQKLNQKPAIFGMVSAVNGNIITMTSKQGLGMMGRGENATTTVTIKSVTFTVDATNAVVTKNNATSTVSSIIVGDTVVVQGTITGTDVVATNIRDGQIMNRGVKKTASSTPPVMGNGEPVIAGKVSAINGNSLSITNNSNFTYTIDVTNAKITQGKNTIAVTNILVGDMVIVQGTVNGTAVTASSVMDQTKVKTNGQMKNTPGFFGRIGGFFAHLFGF